MPGKVYHGRTATLAHQFETAFRTAPVAPNTQLLKFERCTMGRDPELPDDETINADALREKRDEQDSMAPVSLQARLCLNDAGTFLRMLLGAPVTTGPVGGVYTHVFTLDLNDRPTALLELALTESTPSTRYHRHLGVMMNTMGWSLIDVAQRFAMEMIGAVEVRPYPVAAFDNTPTALRAMNAACKKNGKIWDGAAAIGDIAAGTIQFGNELDPQSLADGLEGYGAILLGQPSVTGSVDVLFKPGELVDDALARTSKHLVLESKNAAGDHSLIVDVPSAEFDVPRIPIETSKGIVVRGIGWRAHRNATPVTVTLKNAVAAY
jgi:hypothetical protein